MSNVKGDRLTKIGAVKSAADGFYTLAQILVKSLPSDLATVPSMARPEHGDVMASVTNYILAIELYFKAILKICHQRVPRTHDLISLFERVPEPVGSYIISKYNALPVDRSKAAALILYFSPVQNFPLSEEARDHNISDVSFEAVLERNRNAFVQWRYLYEDFDRSEVKAFTYEYSSLGLICEALRGVVTELHHG